MAVLKPNQVAQRARRQLVLTATIVLAGVAALWVLLRQPTQLVVNVPQQVRRGPMPSARVVAGCQPP